MTKRAGLMVLMIALFMAFIASATVLKYVKKINSNHQEAPKTSPVVITRVSVPAGSSLLDTQVVVAQRPIDSIPEGAIRSLKDAQGRVVRTSLYPGEMVMDERLIKRGSMGGLPSMIPIGMRAITLKVDDTISVSGFIRPGHYIDVMTTIDVDNEQDQTITKTILQAIQVVATGKEIENQEDDKKVKVVPTVTVLVTLEQAERLALASNAGSIRLVLRNYEDLAEIPTEGVTLASLIPQTHRELELPKPILVEENDVPEPLPTPQRMHVIEVYRGTERSEVSLAQ